MTPKASSAKAFEAPSEPRFAPSESLQRATRPLLETCPPDQMFRRVLSGALEALGGTLALLFVHDRVGQADGAGRNCLRGKGAWTGSNEGWEREAVNGLEISLDRPDDPLTRAVAEVRSLFHDTEGHLLSFEGRIPPQFRAESWAIAPLVDADGAVGALLIGGIPRQGAADDQVLLWLDAFGANAGRALTRVLDCEAIRESEQRSHQFLENSPDGILESTLDGRILYCNEACSRLFGLSREEAMSRNLQSFYANPEQSDELIKLNDQRGRVESMDVTVKREDGSISYVNISTRLCRGREEAVLQCIIRDVSERYEVDRKIRLLADAVTNTVEAIISLEPEGIVTSWNLGAEKIFGYTPEEMIGKPYMALVPEDLQDELCNIIRPKAEREGHLPAYETERLHRDGSRVPVSITVTRLRRDRGPDLGWSVVARDITENKRAEQRRSLLSSITEQSPDAILSIDNEGVVTSWNLGAEKMFGISADAIQGRSWLMLAPPERESEFLEITTPGNDPSPRAIDTFARTRDGRLLPVRLSSSVLVSDTDRLSGWSLLLRDLTEQRTLAEMSERLKQELYSRNRLEGIVGNSRVMEEVRERIRRVSRFGSSVLLVGPSGTGKEVVANAVHYNSPRRDKPFIKVNCAAIPEHLLESELFGIERNVATGVDGRIGRFEMADEGTLFLDEIGDMSLSTQAKILRVLQEREFERVGGKQVIKVDVRIIAATNKNLDKEIEARRFRNDLYYRLNVIVITLPPLAERREDIDPLIDHFLDKFTRENDLPRKELSMSTRILLNQYDWPGNVRELEHCIERAVVMGMGREIVESDLPPGILIWKELGGGPAGNNGKGTSGLSEVLRQVERRTVLDALERSGWVQAKAARVLGISERSMWYRVKKLGLKPL